MDDSLESMCLAPVSKSHPASWPHRNGPRQSSVRPFPDPVGCEWLRDMGVDPRLKSNLHEPLSQLGITTLRGSFTHLHWGHVNSGAGGQPSSDTEKAAAERREMKQMPTGSSAKKPQHPTALHQGRPLPRGGLHLFRRPLLQSQEKGRLLPGTLTVLWCYQVSAEGARSAGVWQGKS